MLTLFIVLDLILFNLFIITINKKGGVVTMITVGYGDIVPVT